jgi:hypothetical protein
MKILYFENSEWEIDYIVSDIFENKVDVEFFNETNITRFLTRDDLVNNCVFCTNHSIDFDIVIKVIQFLRPVAIFWFSDEYGLNSKCLSMSNYTRILFRNYNHPSYEYPKCSVQFPLGYVKGFLSGYASNKLVMNKMDNRHISCSFVGQLKSDRAEMSSIFSKMPNCFIKPVYNNWNLNSLPFSPNDLFKVYYNSVFVPIGRGNFSLDCFRIYEAIVSGAIPVIVGSAQEITNTLNYAGYPPTIVQAESWEKAYEICSALLLNINELQAMQDKNVVWWKYQLDSIRNKIAELI